MKTKTFPIRILIGALALTAPLAIWAADDAKPAAPAAQPQPARRSANAPTAANPIAGLKTAIDDLKLTGDTKTKADDILAKAQADADNATKAAAGDRRAGFQKTSEIVKNAAEQITALLDEDQKLMLRSKLQAAAKLGANEPPPGAGPGGPGAPGAGRGAFMAQRMKDVTATLGLSDEQSKKVDAAVADLQKKAEDIRAAGPDREKIMALREDGLKQMKAILTEEQFTKFEEAMRQPPAGAGGRVGAMVQRFQDAIKDLNLTQDQEPKVQGALADARKKFAALAPSVQGGQPSPDVREKFRTAMEDLRTELMGILTPEQQEKFRAAMQQGAGAGGAGPGARPRPAAGTEKPADK
jgi:Spy/CpxP family protein refolding chaperone